MAFEDHQGMIDRLSIGSVVETQLLLPVRRVGGGVQVQHDLAAPAHLVAGMLHKPLQQQGVQAHPIAGRKSILPTAEGGLGSERVTQGSVTEELKGRVMAQTIGVVGVFITGHDLIEPLAKQAEQRVLHLPRAASVGQGSHYAGRQPSVVVELTERQQTRIAGDLPAAKIRPQTTSGARQAI